MKAVQEKKNPPKRTLKQLKNDQKIALLKTAKKLLGAKGQNWTRQNWFAYRVNPKDRGIQSTPDEANSWCLLGALEEAAYRLGYSEHRSAAERFADMSSVQKLVEKKTGLSVVSFNDSPHTEWEDVRNIIDERLAQLEGKKK